MTDDAPEDCSTDRALGRPLLLGRVTVPAAAVGQEGKERYATDAKKDLYLLHELFPLRDACRCRGKMRIPIPTNAKFYGLP